MATWATLAAQVWRNYVTDGVPASGNRNTPKSDIRQWGLDAETNIAAIETAATALTARVTTAESDIDTLQARFVWNASVSDQTGFASDTYLTGSRILIPNSRIQAGSVYRCTFDVSKTAAGTATPEITVRIGTVGDATDASRGVLTFPAQTAVADDGLFDVLCTFRTVGSGTAAVLQTVGRLTHSLNSTGLANVAAVTKRATSSGFNSSTSNLYIGLSVNGGASASWTVSLVQARLENLA